jgi:mannosyltransferase OCH1-like enzyme
MSSSSCGLQKRNSTGLLRRGKLQNGRAAENGCSSSNGYSANGDEEEEVLILDTSVTTSPSSRQPSPRISVLAKAMTMMDSPLSSHNAVHPWISRVHHRPRRLLVVVVLVFFLTCVLLRKRLMQLRSDLFGDHYIIGLLAAGLVQDRGLQWVYHQTLQKQEAELREIGVQLPPSTLGSGSNLLNIQTQAAMRELLIRREQRGRILFSLEEQAMKDSCRHYGGGVERRDCTIPKVLFVPSILSWTPPRPRTFPGFARLLFDEAEMRDLVQDVMPSLVPIFDALAVQPHERVYLWALCAVYHFGGVYLGSSSFHHHVQQQVLLKDDLLVPVADFILNGTASRGPIGISVLENATNTPEAGQGIDTYMVAATPRHAHLYCLLRGLETSVNASLSSSFSISKLLYHPSSLHVPLAHRWNGFRTNHRVSATTRGCDTVQLQNVPPTGPGTLGAFQQVDSESRPDFYILHREAVTQMQSEPRQNVDVTITSQDDQLALSLGLREKVSIRSQLQSNGSEPSWFCTQCLRLPSHGTIGECKRLCPKRYTSLICRGPEVPEKVDVSMMVLVKQQQHQQQQHNESSSRRPSTIPKIIHQTWFEQVNLDRYPDLARLQSSWKQSGWDYRFYTDVTARLYIVKHFPARFVDAFDALIPGAYRADLFRYLVLLKDGGVYADMDVLLETTLDTFVTPTMSFFAARDCVAEFAAQPFCLWNGLIGAAPGHPFIIRTVERLVNLVSNRADAYDLERDLCGRNNTATRSGVNLDTDKFEIWKVRLETLLLLSGPCALGVAVNDVLGRPSLQALELGWIGLDALEYGTALDGTRNLYDYGDALLLTLDKYDFGAFRFSDSERNIIVASTQLEGLEKKPRVVRHASRGVIQRQQEALATFKPITHYSETQKGVTVWGNKGVYRDNLVSPERLVFHIHYER